MNRIVTAPHGITYGALELSAKILAILGIIATLLFIGACVAHWLKLHVAGVVAQLVCTIPVVVLIVTWFTEMGSYDWSADGPFPIVGAILILAILLLGPPRIGSFIDDHT